MINYNLSAEEYLKVFLKNVPVDDKASSKVWMAKFAEAYHQYRKDKYWIIRFLKL